MSLVLPKLKFYTYFKINNKCFTASIFVLLVLSWVLIDVRTWDFSLWTTRVVSLCMEAILQMVHQHFKTKSKNSARWQSSVRYGVNITYSEIRRPHNNIPEDTSLLGLSLARGWWGACLVGTFPSRESDQPAGKWTMYFRRDASTVHVFATCTAKEINDRFSRSVGIVYSWLLKSSCARCWI